MQFLWHHMKNRLILRRWICAQNSRYNQLKIKAACSNQSEQNQSMSPTATVCFYFRNRIDSESQDTKNKTTYSSHAALKSHSIMHFYHSYEHLKKLQTNILPR